MSLPPPGLPYHRTTRRFTVVLLPFLLLCAFWMTMMVLIPPDFLALAVEEGLALPWLYRPLALLGLLLTLTGFATLTTAAATAHRLGDAGAGLSRAGAWAAFGGLSVFAVLGFAMLGSGVDCGKAIADATPWDWVVCRSGDGGEPVVYGLSHLIPYLPVWTAVLALVLRTRALDRR